MLMFKEDGIAMHYRLYQSVVIRRWCRCYWILGRMLILKEESMVMHYRPY
jgi:hypothetical protein